MQALSKDELNALLTVAYADSKRNWLMFVVTYWHGLRASETVGLKVADINGGFIDVQRLKGSMRTVQPLVEHADPLLNEKAALLEFIQGMHREQKVFSVTRKTFWALFQKYGALAGLPQHKRHPHCLKHSIAIHSIAKAGVENVRQYLGHRSLNSTGAYLRKSDEEASAACQSAVLA